MDNNLVEKLQFAYMCDLKKKDIDKFERAKIILDYMEKNKLSKRALSREMGIKLTTLHGWIQYDKITIKQYETFRRDGLSEADIFNALKRRESESIKEKKAFDLFLEDWISNTKIVIRDIDNHNQDKISPTTLGKIKELQDNLNRLVMKIERNLIND